VICLLETAAFDVTDALTLWRWLDLDPEPPQPTIRSIPASRTRNDASRQADIPMIRTRAKTAAVRGGPTQASGEYASGIPEGDATRV
jgi:hypothetical protein